jgi:hypothetical protein
MIKRLSQIEKLRPEFELSGGMRMVDWFHLHKGKNWITIVSGLRHADGETISPYHYEATFVGNYAKRDALRAFRAWWDMILITQEGANGL